LISHNSITLYWFLYTSQKPKFRHSNSEFCHAQSGQISAILRIFDLIPFAPAQCAIRLAMCNIICPIGAGTYVAWKVRAKSIKTYLLVESDLWSLVMYGERMTEFLDCSFEFAGT